jgi:preprotein translocase subunit SecG
LTVHVLAGLGVIGLVLMQHGKGRTWGRPSEVVPRVVCSARRLGKLPQPHHGGARRGVFVTSLGLSYLAGAKTPATSSVMGTEVPAQTPAAGAIPAPAAPAEDGSKAKDIPR